MEEAGPIILKGEVTRFKGNGRKLGYPTANLDVGTDARDGVYFGFADLAGFKNHPSLIFIGTPSTMGDTERRIEAHLLDIPDTDYYGLTMSLKLEKYHRPNSTFNNIDELVSVMKADEAAARHWFDARK